MHYKESNGNDHLAGCTSLQEIMNFTYTVIKPPDEQWGSIQPDGTWSGMVNLLANQDVDIATAPFTVTEERSAVMTFASPITKINTIIQAKVFDVFERIDAKFFLLDYYLFESSKELF